MHVTKARLTLLVAAGLASAVLAFELPVAELVHQQHELSTAGAELSAVRALDARLSADVASLRRASTVEAIAHAEYGLVRPGEQAYSVPGLGGRAGAGGARGVAPGLEPSRLSPEDLYLSSPTALLPPPRRTGAGAGGAATGSLWSRVLGHLEFWRWAF